MQHSQPIGKLIRVHTVSAVSVQRAAVVAVISFLFFLGMLLAFYIRAQFGYFMLSSAFLVVYLFTMVGLWLQKRNVLNVYENGLSYRGKTLRWDEIDGYDTEDRGGLAIRSKKGEPLRLPSSLVGLDDVGRSIESNLTSSK